MSRCGIASIDDLFEGRSATPIGPGTTDQAAVSEIQDFLRCQGFPGLPGLLGPGRGVFGPKTQEAVRGFRSAHSLGDGESVDSATLRALVETPATRPLASRAYLALALGIDIQGMAWIVSLTSHFESARSFSAMCLNTDRAGLSFGLIQWAQKPGRLNEILRAFDQADHARFVAVFGAGDESLAQGLLAHTARPDGGVDTQTGVATNPAFDLIHDPWPARFQAAALERGWQRVQCETAIADFSDSYQRLKPSAPQIRSERGVAFLLDLANQHGEGGARSIYRAAARPGASEPEVLAAMADESVRRLVAQFGADSAAVKATIDRRTFFRTTNLLADAGFEDSAASARA